jgi:hypothetical protein
MGSTFKNVTKIIRTLRSELNVIKDVIFHFKRLACMGSAPCFNPKLFVCFFKRIYVMLHSCLWHDMSTLISSRNRKLHFTQTVQHAQHRVGPWDQRVFLFYLYSILRRPKRVTNTLIRDRERLYLGNTEGCKRHLKTSSTLTSSLLHVAHTSFEEGSLDNLVVATYPCIRVHEMSLKLFRSNRSTVAQNQWRRINYKNSNQPTVIHQSQKQNAEYWMQGKGKVVPVLN